MMEPTTKKPERATKPRTTMLLIGTRIRRLPPDMMLPSINTAGMLGQGGMIWSHVGFLRKTSAGGFRMLVRMCGSQ